MRSLVALLLFALAFPAAAAEPPAPPWRAPLAQEHPLVGKIWLPAEGRFIEPADLARRMVSADFVLLGEHHDNVDHHRLQAWALSQVLAVGRRPVLAFEMLTPDQGPALRRYIAEHPGQTEGLDQALDWANSHWPDWSNYRPLFAEGLSAGMEIRAANLPNGAVHALAHGEAFPDPMIKYFRLDQPLEPRVADALSKEIKESHCGQMPERMLPGMITVQRARDAVMAHTMADKAPTGAVLIAGTGHIRNDWGVPVHLAALAAGRPAFALAFLEVADDDNDPAAYSEAFGAPQLPFDAVWFTPRQSDEDPCAGLAEFLKKKKEQEEKAGKGKE